MFRALMIAALLCIGTQASAATLTVGTRIHDNAFPFSPRPGATRYQQVWDSSIFERIGAVEITKISFELSSWARTAPDATFDLSFSTTRAGVNGLNTDGSEAGFDSNLGADNALFNRTVFNGEAVSGTLDFAGSFIFDPTYGNLILDMQISDVGSYYMGPAVAATNNAAGLFSRSHNYGSGFENYGAIATFEYNEISEVPLPASAAFLGFGALALGFATRKRRKSA